VNSNLKTGVFWVVLVCVALLAWQVVKSGRTRPQKTITFTGFIREVEAGKVWKVTISDGHVQGEYKDNASILHTLIPRHYVEIYKILQDSGVEIEIEEKSGGWVSVLINASPFLLLLAFWVFMMRQMQGGRKSGPPSGITRLPPEKLLNPRGSHITSIIVGCKS
jgi:cell division protease FtsH